MRKRVPWRVGDGDADAAPATDADPVPARLRLNTDANCMQGLRFLFEDLGFGNEGRRFWNRSTQIFN